MTQVNMNEAKKQLSKLIELVLKGEEVIIARRNKPIVKLVPLETVKTKRKIGSAKGLIAISDDFENHML